MASRPLPISAANFIPPPPHSVPKLTTACQACRGCELYKHATQAVFGQGPRTARIVMVGEQPGDQEDQKGAPFVGPAGRVLDEALDAAKIDRALVYVTNAVKHFRFEQRGKRRMHSKPSARHIAACRPWLEAEMALIKPDLVIAMGATAAQSLLGPAFRLTQHRQEILLDTPWAPAAVMATIHPSAILRMPDPEKRHQAREEFARDLALARKYLESRRPDRIGREESRSRPGRSNPAPPRRTGARRA
jgi:uracil-DNA glycosylase family protein